MQVSTVLLKTSRVIVKSRGLNKHTGALIMYFVERFFGTLISVFMCDVLCYVNAAFPGFALGTESRVFYN